MDQTRTIGKSATHDNEEVGEGSSAIRIFRFPILKEFEERLRLIGRGGLSCLILVVDAVAGGADEDFAGLKGHPVAFAYDRFALRIGQLPRERALAIREKALALAHPDLVKSLDEQAGVLRTLHRDGQAAALGARAPERRAKRS
ncbi:MAG: hypothetical protein EWM72_02492 [Nitrospira sp.]|nr:MAG: hypothetical protein EWM72_02492 [Nitrospira sp.]